MSHPSEYTVSDVAVRQARAYGIHGDAAARLRGLAAFSSPTIHVSGNAAYGPFVLLLRGKHVVAVTLIGPKTVDTRDVSQCSFCGGMMAREIRTILDGKEGVARRPCPRAFDTTKPLCDAPQEKPE